MIKWKLKKTVCFLWIAALLFVGGCTKQEEASKGNTGNDMSVGVEISQIGNQSKPDESETDSLKADLVEYSVYRLDEIDFQFIIAKIRIKGQESIHLDLSHFVTDEKIALNQVEDYVSQLEENGLFLGKQNVWFELISNEASAMFNIFIPIKDKAKTTLDLNIDFDDNISFDLTKANGTKEMLCYQPDDVITDGKTYQMKVSNAFLITGDTITRTYPDGYSEEYMVPSTAEVHAFKIDAVSLWGDEVIIEKAIYTVSSTHESFEAFNEQFSTMKNENLINKVITDKDSGVLFFETLNPSESPIQYQGTLELTIKGQSKPIVIHVDL